ncbi:MAG TPA: hypothetical protein VKE40_12470 [Gemmataceae bacterium]|nr:hypothetical protein [Gemmataceae bacterium]
MPAANLELAEELRRLWTDRLVMPKTDKPELKRFEGKIGRVVTVNWSGKALVDFGDGAWYDVPASEEYLTTLAPDDPNRSKYDAKANSAQPRPERQG